MSVLGVAPRACVCNCRRLGVTPRWPSDVEKPCAAATPPMGNVCADEGVSGSKCGGRSPRIAIGVLQGEGDTDRVSRTRSDLVSEFSQGHVGLYSSSLTAVGPEGLVSCQRTIRADASPCIAQLGRECPVASGSSPKPLRGDQSPSDLHRPTTRSEVGRASFRRFRLRCWPFGEESYTVVVVSCRFGTPNKQRLSESDAAYPTDAVACKPGIQTDTGSKTADVPLKLQGDVGEEAPAPTMTSIPFSETRLGLAFDANKGSPHARVRRFSCAALANKSRTRGDSRKWSDKSDSESSSLSKDTLPPKQHAQRGSFFAAVPDAADSDIPCGDPWRCWKPLACLAGD